jgi:hypothetical protein
MLSLDSNPLQHPQPGSWLPHSIAPIPAHSRKLIAPTEQFDTPSSPLTALRLQKQHAQTGPCSQGAGTGPVEASPRRINPYQPYQPVSRQETDEALPTRGGPLSPLWPPARPTFAVTCSFCLSFPQGICFWFLPREISPRYKHQTSSEQL